VPDTPPAGPDAPAAVPGAPGAASLAAESAARWRAVRAVLSTNRHELGGVAARLYPDVPRIGTSGLLCRERWLPAVPLDLDELPLSWDGDPPGPPDRGAAAEHVRPLRPDGTRYASYADAVAALDRPGLFEDRPSYRLLDASLTAPPGLRLGRTSYFEGMELGHAVAHELAAAWGRSAGAVTMAELPLRALAGDPRELGRRCSLSAVTALTLRRAARGDASFVLHWRDPAKVNHAGGLYQVMPVGLFQPVTGVRAALGHDLSLWKCLVREYSEEFLGMPEDYPASGGLLDYEGWPFYRRLAGARREGRLTVHCVGLGIDPLTFATDILAVAVFDAGLFDAEFARLVARNAEGRVITGGDSAGIPLTADVVAKLTGGVEPVQASGAAVLQLAWNHRRHLLG
jgi:hypothetical protein